MIKHAAEKLINFRPYLNSSLRINFGSNANEGITRPRAFPDPGSFNPHPNLNSDRVPARTRTNKSHDNNLKLGAKNPE